MQNNNKSLIVITDRAHFLQAVEQGSYSSPVLLFFFCNWCKVSTMLKAVLEELAQQFEGAFKLAVVPSDLADLEDKKKEYKGKERPHVVLLNDGNVVGSFSGGLPRHKIIQFLNLHDIFG